MNKEREDFVKIDLTQEERERCKAVIERKFKALIEHREKTIKHKSRHLTATFNKLKEGILFLIDNPNYKRLGERVKELEKEIIKLREVENGK